MTAALPITAAPTRLAVPKREWGTAFSALRRLLTDKDDTRAVFEIMRALNGGATRAGYRRLLTTAEGGRLAYQRTELAEKLADRDWLASPPDESLGAAYRRFTDKAQITPEGLVDVSRSVMDDRIEHPVAWYGRRIRDTHDLWHTVTGYGTDSLGEACLVAFSYAQTRALGWAAIAVGAAIKSRKAPDQPYARAILEGYRRGRAAAWLPAQDWLALLPQPLEAVRARLALTPPPIYLSIPVDLRGQAIPKG